MGIRLVSIDDVLDIICKYENRAIQKTMVYEIQKLDSCLSTDEQMIEIQGNKDIDFEE